MNLVLTASAERDVLRLRRFVAAYDPRAARKLSAQLLRDIQRLRNHPQLGRRIEVAPPEPHLRQLTTQYYAVRYWLLKDKIVVLRIWHQREARND